jgi:hypothetical protein
MNRHDGDEDERDEDNEAIAALPRLRALYRRVVIASRVHSWLSSRLPHDLLVAPRDERNGRALLEKRHSRGHLTRADGEFLSEAGVYRFHS